MYPFCGLKLEFSYESGNCSYGVVPSSNENDRWSDLKFMQSFGIKSFLIGETFMKSENIKKSVKKILYGD